MGKLMDLKVYKFPIFSILALENGASLFTLVFPNGSVLTLLNLRIFFFSSLFPLSGTYEDYETPNAFFTRSLKPSVPFNFSLHDRPVRFCRATSFSSPRWTVRSLCWRSTCTRPTRFSCVK